MDPAAVAERIFPGRVRHVEPLGGGITNHNFRIDLGDETVVLRVAGKDTDLLGIDRADERDASVAAAALGVGPDVVGFVEPEGYLVTRFIEGRPIPVEEMRRRDATRRVARALRRVHEGPPIPGRFDSFRVVETYAETAAAHGVEVPDDYGWAKGVADRIEAARGGEAPVPCHNDLLNANFLDDGAAVRIVDWEYAGMGDRFFDLANFSINHEFDAAADETLLEAYFGSVEQGDVRALRLMRFMSDFREAMWGVVQQGISELDVDFVAYAGEHFERLRRTAADPAFDQALRG
jgi:thiamine kinase-like enzyme